MSFRVTFDSNTWEPIFGLGAAISLQQEELDEIANATRRGLISAWICDVFAKLEAIPKIRSASSRHKTRLAFFQGDRIQTETCLVENDDPSRVRGRVAFTPDLTDHGGVPQQQAPKLQAAKLAGVQFFGVPRFGLGYPDSFDLPRLRETNDAFWGMCEKASVILGRIQERGVGEARYIELKQWHQQQMQERNLPLRPYLEQLPKTDFQKFDEAIAEWADGDAIACHIAHNNDYFCTEDRGRNASRSVLNEENRAWLEGEYGVRFLSIQQLSELLR